jgi:hypothetical protein
MEGSHYVVQVDSRLSDSSDLPASPVLGLQVCHQTNAVALNVGNKQMMPSLW